MSIRIVCITKPDRFSPHEAISHYGWVEDETNKSDVTARQIVVKWVNGGIRAYVKDESGNSVDCKVNTSSAGTEFLQTYADGKFSDNLLSLRDCPLK